MSDRSEATWRAIRPDGRILNAALSPDSEYDRAIRTLAEEALHGFQGDAMGYLWSAAPGMVRVSVDERREFLVFSPEAAPSLPGQLLDMATGAVARCCGCSRACTNRRCTTMLRQAGVLPGAGCSAWGNSCVGMTRPKGHYFIS